MKQTPKPIHKSKAHSREFKKHTKSPRLFTEIQSDTYTQLNNYQTFIVNIHTVQRNRWTKQSDQPTPLSSPVHHTFLAQPFCLHLKVLFYSLHSSCFQLKLFTLHFAFCREKITFAYRHTGAMATKSTKFTGVHAHQSLVCSTVSHRSFTDHL